MRLAASLSGSALALMLSVVGPGIGQAVAQAGLPPPPIGSRHSLLAGVALEPDAVLLLGYAHWLGRLDDRSAISVGGSVKMPFTIFSRGAVRVNLGASARWLSPSGWGTTFTALGYAAHNRNRAGGMTGLGVELRVTPGYFGSRWGGGLDLGWQRTLRTHISHSGATRETFEGRYPAGVGGPTGPRDGWYGGTAQRFRVGVTGVHTLSDGSALQLSLGGLFVRQRQGVLLVFDLAQVPFYLETSFRVGW